MCTWHDLVARNSKNGGREIANACHFLLCLADPRGVCIENHPTHFLFGIQSKTCYLTNKCMYLLPSAPIIQAAPA